MKPIKWLAILGVGAAAGLEFWYQTREKRPCRMLPKLRTPWKIENQENHRTYHCTIPIRNFNHHYEATVVDVRPTVRLLAKNNLPADVTIGASVKPLHKESRDDGYWPAYILTPQTTLDFELKLICQGHLSSLSDLHAIVVRLDYEIYSRREKQYKSEDIILIPDQDIKAHLAPVVDKDIIIYPIKTHILTDADNMIDVIEKYVKPIAEEDDIVVLAESVVAITQRRYQTPEQIKPGWWAGRLCYLIPNVGSLSSRYGMQAAINDVGLPRMLAAVGIGAIMKAVGQNGWLYRVAGLPAELIDDVTGTMPPFDKYLVFGPDNPQGVVDHIKLKTGLDTVIADVNNLKRAKILAASEGVDMEFVSQKLLNNPLGNASEQTPIVLLRLPESAKISTQTEKETIQQ